MQVMNELGRWEAPARETKRRRLRDSRELSNGADVWDIAGYAPVLPCAAEYRNTDVEVAESSGRSEAIPPLGAVLDKGWPGSIHRYSQDVEEPESSAGAAASAATAVPLDMTYQEAGPASTASEVLQQVSSMSRKSAMLQCQDYEGAAARSASLHMQQGHAGHACSSAYSGAAIAPWLAVSIALLYLSAHYALVRVQMDPEGEQRRASSAWRHAHGRRRGKLTKSDRKQGNMPYVACSGRKGSCAILDPVARSIKKDRSIFMRACQLYMADILLHLRHAS